MKNACKLIKYMLMLLVTRYGCIVQLLYYLIEKCQLQPADKSTGIAHYNYRAMPMPLVTRSQQESFD